MNKKDKKGFLIGLLIIGIVGIYIILAFVGIFPFPAFISSLLNRNEILSDSERIALMLSKSHPTDILILGNEILFSEEIESKKIDSLENISNIKESDKKYCVLIINDLNNSINLSGEEINSVNNLILQENTMVIYLGKKYADVWDDKSQAIANVQGNLCYAYYQINSVMKRNVGSWMEDNTEMLQEHPYILGDVMLNLIELYIQEIQ